MKHALVEARKGLGFVHPNPMVGAVILDTNEKFISAGHHARHGTDHAEVMALSKAGPRAKNGTLYVTLEPCNHHGKTPPCTDAIIHSGIKKVIVAMVDPNPKVVGSGIQKLRDAGIEVELGIEVERAAKLNVAFIHWIKTNTPFVRTKMAMTIEGYVGHRQKRILLSGPTLQKITMRLRAESQAIITGVNTILIDNPRLNVRGKYSNRKPVRIILDSDLRTPLTSKIFDDGEVWIFCKQEQIQSDAWNLLSSKAKIMGAPAAKDGKLDVNEILFQLSQQGMTSILIEAGASILDSLQAHNLIDQWVIYLNSNNLQTEYKLDQLVQMKTNPLFSLDIQSVITRDRDLVITSKARSLKP